MENPAPSAAKSARWRRRKDDRPVEILEAAVHCFAERGFAATRLEEVAARAGVTKGTLYLYYPGKQELFEAVVRKAVVPNLERIETALAALPDETPAAALLARLIEMMPIDSPRVGAIIKLVITEAGNFPDLARFYRQEVAGRGLRLIRSILRRGSERGEFRPLDEESAALCVIAPLLISILWKRSLEDADHPLDLDKFRRAHLDLILHALAAAQPVQQSP